MPPKSITFSIVDDDAELRDSIVRYLTVKGGFVCAGQYGRAQDALSDLPGEKLSVVLMDIKMKGMDGIECVRRLKEKMPHVLVIMLTVFDDDDLIFDALMAGATGYLLKRVSPDQLLDAIRDVRAGGSAMSSSIARKVVASFQKAAPVAASDTHLSPREQAVLDSLAKGLTYKAIADQLGISIETIRTYLKRIYQKLHVQSRTEAVAKYMRL